MTSVVTAGGVSVTMRGPVIDEAEAVLDRLVTDGVPASLMAKNAQLWGPAAVEEASRRLGWLDLPQTSRSLLPELAAPAPPGGSGPPSCAGPPAVEDEPDERIEIVLPDGTAVRVAATISAATLRRVLAALRQ